LYQQVEGLPHCAWRRDIHPGNQMGAYINADLDGPVKSDGRLYQR
jgi:hypothetical protein